MAGTTTTGNGGATATAPRRTTTTANARDLERRLARAAGILERTEAQMEKLRSTFAALREAVAGGGTGATPARRQGG